MLGRECYVHVRTLGRTKDGFWRAIVTAFEADVALAAWQVMRAWWRYDGREQKANYLVRPWTLERDMLDAVLASRMGR